MNDEIDLTNKEDITKIVGSIVEIHGIGIAEAVLDGLLKTHNPIVLIDILKRKTKEKTNEKYSAFFIAIDVYIEQHEQESSQAKAIAIIGERTGLSKSTIGKHITSFRKTVAQDLKKVNYHADKEELQEFIKNFIEILFNKSHYRDSGEREPTYHEPKRKKTKYQEEYQRLIHDIGIPF